MNASQNKSNGATRLRILLIFAILVLPVGLFVISPLLLIPLVFFVLLAWRGGRRGGPTTHGSARLAEHDDLEKNGLLNEDRGFIVGRALAERRRLIRVLFELFLPRIKSELALSNLKTAVLGKRHSRRPLIRLQRYVHLLFVAPAGAGKGVGIILPNLLTHDGSMVITDFKGENYQKTANRRKWMGHEVYRVDPFGVCGEGANSFNPLALLDAKSQRLMSDARALAESLVVKTGTEHEPHFNDCATDLITAVIVYVVTADAPIEEKNILTCRRLISDSLALAGAVSEMMKSDVAEGALRSLGQTIDGWGNDREKNSIVSTASRHLSFADSPVVSRSLATSSFDPADLVRKKMTVYFCLPPDQLVPLARLNRLWLTSCFMRLSQGELQERVTATFILDEAGSALEKLPALEQAVTLLRGYGVRIAMFLQSLSQLKKVFNSDNGFQTVQANMDQMFWGIRDLETAREISSYIGQTTVQSTSYQQSKSYNRPAWNAIMFGRGKHSDPTVSTTEGYTYSETGRALLQPEELLQLHNNIALVLAKGIPPFACEVVKSYSDPAFAEARAIQNIVKREAAALAAPRRPLLAGPQKLFLNCPKCRVALQSSAAKPGETSRCPRCRAKVTLRRRQGLNGRHAH
jgi:type IV secretion system protein VirD4